MPDEFNYDTLPEEVSGFIDTLTPGDLGHMNFNNYCLRFEGFTEECWDHADEKYVDDPIEGSANEILKEWEDTGKLISFGWTNSVFEEDDRQGIFWAYYECSSKELAIKLIA